MSNGKVQHNISTMYQQLRYQANHYPYHGLKIKKSNKYVSVLKLYQVT